MRVTWPLHQRSPDPCTEGHLTLAPKVTCPPKTTFTGYREANLPKCTYHTFRVPTSWPSWSFIDINQKAGLNLFLCAEFCEIPLFSFWCLQKFIGFLLVGKAHPIRIKYQFLSRISKRYASNQQRLGKWKSRDRPFKKSDKFKRNSKCLIIVSMRMYSRSNAAYLKSSIERRNSSFLST